MSAATHPGQVLGRAAGSLNNSSSWLGDERAARAGASGETATAKELNRVAGQPGGPTVLHDLRIPIPGISANIDHIVVAGRTVIVVDSKLWKPGRYWTFAGSTRRGFERFAPADKQTLPMAAEAIGKMLSASGLRHRIGRPLMVVWPSSKRAHLNLVWFRPRGARAIAGATLEQYALERWAGQPADSAIVAALRPLLLNKRA